MVGKMQVNKAYKNAVFFFIAILVSLSDLGRAQELDYFPMHIGDLWTYELTTFEVQKWGERRVEIIDTTRIDSVPYFVFLETTYLLNPKEVTSRTEYYRRLENGDIVKYSQRVGEEQLFYTFQADFLYQPYLYCDDVIDPFKWQITFIDTNTSANTPSGFFTKCYEYLFDLYDESTGTLLPLEGRQLAPNVGLVKYGGEGDVNQLLGAYIDGNLIGDTTVTSVEEIHRDDTLPNTPVLYQNFPNPFNGNTTVRFFVPNSWTQPVSLVIYDAIGKEVFRYQQDHWTKGSQQFIWNAKTQYGKEVGSGIYFVRLQSGTYSECIKITMLK